MVIEQTNDSYTFRAGNENRRYIDAFGKDVVKFELLSPESTDDTTGDPTRFTSTMTETGSGNTTVVNSSTAGEKILITTDDAEYDGANIQGKGEAFKLVSGKPLYFGIECKISDETQSDFLVGICETLVALINASGSHAIASANVEGVFFSKLDGSTTIAAKTYKDGNQTGTGDYGTAIGTDYRVYEIYYDGSSKVYFYVDDTLVTTATANLPDGDLTPSICFRAGEAAAVTMHVKWWKVIQWR